MSSKCSYKAKKQATHPFTPNRNSNELNIRFTSSTKDFNELISPSPLLKFFLLDDTIRLLYLSRSLGSKPVDFSHLFFSQWCYLFNTTNPPLLSGLGTGTGTIFWFLWQGFWVRMKQESCLKFLPWPGFEPRILAV